MLKFFKNVFFNLHRRRPTVYIHNVDLDLGYNQNSWVSKGENPSLDISSSKPIPGWNMLELDCVLSTSDSTAWLLIDYGSGTVELEVPLRSGKLSKRIVYIPVGVKSITLCFSNVKGELSVGKLEFVWLTPWFARNRLYQRLKNVHPDYRDFSFTDIKKRLIKHSVELSKNWVDVALEDYDSTFVKMTSERHYQKWIHLREARQNVDKKELYQLRMSGRFKCCVAVIVDFNNSSSLSLIKSSLSKSLQSLQDQYLLPEKVMLLVPNVLDEELREWVVSKKLSALRNVEFVVSDASLAEKRKNIALCCEDMWVWFLQSGDCLSSKALYFAARKVEANPDVKLLVTDEDTIDHSGERQLPFFKPEWNTDLLFAMPYTGRGVCFHSSVLCLPSIYTSDVEDLSLDYLNYAQVLSFSCLPGFNSDWSARIAHVSYHQCISSRSASYYIDILKLHFIHAGINATVSPGLLPGTQRISWPTPVPSPLVSLIVPTRDGVHILKPCIDALLDRTSYSHFELIIIDNQSTCVDTLCYLKEVEARDSRVRVLSWNAPFNYSEINNFGVANAVGSIIGLINNDVEPIDADWLTEMVQQVSRVDIGCVGAKLYYPNNTIQHGGVILGLGGLAGHAHRFFHANENGYMGRLKVIQNLSAVTAACLLVRKDVFNEVNGLNEKDLAVAYNDVDLCIKVREAGYRNIWTPYAQLYHHESISRGADDTPEKRARWLSEYAYMRNTWGVILDNDPAYNPNLTVVYEDFSLK